MSKNKKIFFQILLVFGVLGFLGILTNNLIINLTRTGIGFNFNWLTKPASFSLAEHPLPYSPSDSYAWALFMGWMNSLKVIISSLVLASCIGTLIGFLRVGKNSFFRVITAGYITVIRQTPLLIQLMCWYFVGFLSIRNNSFLNLSNKINISNPFIGNINFIT